MSHLREEKTEKLLRWSKRERMTGDVGKRWPLRYDLFGKSVKDLGVLELNNINTRLK